MRPRATLHLLIGPVGAGKTTYAERRRARASAVFLDQDAWMVRLYGEDVRPTENVLEWYFERRERCRALMWNLALELIRAGTDVILELGLVTAAERARYFEEAAREELTFAVYLLDAPRDVRRKRVSERNGSAQPFTQVVPPEFFERSSDAWEPPTETERVAWNMVDV